jgi:opacity protein-like surface antigen
VARAVTFGYAIVWEHLVVAQMHIVSGRSGFAFAFALAVLCLDAPAAHAQSTPLPYWTSGWQTSLGSGFAGGQGSNPYGNLLAFGGGDIASGNFSSRYNFDNGWFVGSERGGSGLGANGFTPVGAWSNLGALSYEGVQFGYNFKNSPVTVYAGFDTLKNNSGIGNPLAGFDSTSNAASGYGVRAGVEFRPTSNLSLSVGASFTQPPQGIDTGFNSVPGATSFAFGARR